ncbi:GNAT family N-acetyltransferase [Ramlibacter sp. MMS24-I3-19]|uniref:GNAT family N-acetyltransferase n=1 Tax=Ramlibacter sp. MMS24-I3-19 TaxID=3416606 RepID=UPI003D04AC83
MSTTIVDVQPGDVAVIKAFIAQVIANAVTQDERLLGDLRANVEGNVDWWLAHPQDTVHLKAVRDGRVVGVVLVKQFWNLCSLFVESGSQGQGLGRALVEAAIDRCTGRSPKQALWLNAAPGAGGFYRRLGFTERPPTQALPPGFVAMERLL